MNPLIDIIPTAYRRYLYAVVALALYVYSVYLASKGHWDQFAVSLGTAFVHTVAAANTVVTPKSDGIVVVGPTDPNALALDPAPQANPAPAPAQTASTDGMVAATDASAADPVSPVGLQPGVPDPSPTA